MIVRRRVAAGSKDNASHRLIRGDRKLRRIQDRNRIIERPGWIVDRRRAGNTARYLHVLIDDGIRLAVYPVTDLIERILSCAAKRGCIGSRGRRWHIRCNAA